MRKRRRPKNGRRRFLSTLTSARNPTAQNAENNPSNSDEDENKENRLRFIEAQELIHPSNHLGEKFTDLRKQRCNNRGSSLKSSSFLKNIYGHLSRTEQENQHRENSSEDNEIANFGNRKDTETILQRKNFHQLMRPQIAFLIQVTVVMKTRTTSKAETQACGLRT